MSSRARFAVQTSAPRPPGRPVVTAATGTWTYTIDEGPRIIDPTGTWVVDPVPGESAGAEPTDSRITLTTCHPRYGSSQRMYVSGVLTDGEES